MFAHFWELVVILIILVILVGIAALAWLVLAAVGGRIGKAKRN
jgi:hypothetical protein